MAFVEPEIRTDDWIDGSLLHSSKGDCLGMAGDEKYAQQIAGLKVERDRLVTDLERWREALKTEVDPDADEGDPDLVEREKVVALVKTLERKLDLVELAIRRAEDGLYGICERCGNPIDPERLEVKPEATLCIDCRAVMERQSRAGAAVGS